LVMWATIALVFASLIARLLEPNRRESISSQGVGA
jgi:hypothetical protein